MLVGIMSRRCFHCVAIDQFTGPNHVADHIDALINSKCPICGTTIHKGDLDVTVDPEDLDRIGENRAVWNPRDKRPENFAKFFTGGPMAGDKFGDVAGKLMGPIVNAAEKRRKDMCRIGTAVMLPLVLTHAREAETAGKLDVAARAYEVCIEYGDETLVALASFQLGDLEQKRDNPAAAARHFGKAALSKDTEVRASALLLQAMALHGMGDRADALRSYRQCVDCGRTRVLAMAAYRLGLLLEFNGDKSGAYAAYETAVDARDGYDSAKAALNLAILEEANGRWAEAKNLCEYAFASESADAKAAAAYNLGRAWELDGNIGKAKKFYRIAADSAHAESAQHARQRLLELD